MKRTSYPILLLLSVTIAFLCVHCKEDCAVSSDCACSSTQQSTCVIYEETYCADPWGAGFTNDVEMVEAMDILLDSLDIELQDVGIAMTGTPEACLACFCKTGRSICGTVSNDDVGSIKELGFIEQ